MAQGAGSDPHKPKLMPVSAIDYVSGYLMAFGALVALERRAREGGSWLVRVSLARTGKWIVDRGYNENFAAVARELEEETLTGLLMETKGPSATFRHLKPVLRMSETQPYWERPPSPLGTHPAAWPARSCDE
jgi:crotonobetainyl-CoA:carnitine CoA-transferase CaiB-like acyl-CoA transferase